MSVLRMALLIWLLRLFLLDTQSEATRPMAFAASTTLETFSPTGPACNSTCTAHVQAEYDRRRGPWTGAPGHLHGPPQTAGILPCWERWVWLLPRLHTSPNLLHTSLTLLHTSLKLLHKALA
ncbi:MAG: hypothetical protein FRX49_06815 [Trebouxia sp. A1-2]|nr:MAG: hypothetical protein FRX49_06815 [Trebouxia sp. A1-2]